MVEKIPGYYYDLYGSCAEHIFQTEQMSEKIEKAHNKNRFLGSIVEGYYRVFKGYRSEKEIMKSAFDSIKPSLIKTIEEIESSKL